MGKPDCSRSHDRGGGAGAEMMKQFWTIIILVCILSACTPTPPCDPCAEIDALQTRVQALEGVTDTPTATPSATASSTPSSTWTRTATGTPTFTPAVIPTQTPTGTHPGYVLEVAADPIQQIPSRRVTFTIAWDGPAAELRLNLPPQTCCPIPDPARWMVEGSGIVTATVLMNSTASGAKMFQAVAYVGGTIVKTDSVWVEVIAAGATATPTIAPTVTPGGPTPTATPTPLPVQRFEPLRWYNVENPAKLPLLWLYNVSKPVGAPGGKVWSYTADALAPLDWEYATGHGWLILETGGGDVWLWMDTPAPMDVLTVKFTERTG